MAKKSDRPSTRLDNSQEEKNDLVKIKILLHSMLKKLCEDHDYRIYKLETVIFTREQKI